MALSFILNGSACTVEADPRETLLHVLRERLGLLGTKCGCGEGECGACTVLLNDRPVTSCLVLAGQAHGARVDTIEGMSVDPIGKHILSAFLEAGAVQCGFCTPGVVISTRHLLSQNPRPSIEEIKTALGGNLCRCTGYTKIIDGVKAASKKLNSELPETGQTPEPVRGLKTDTYIQPDSLEEALNLLEDGTGWQVLSGASDLGVKNLHGMKSEKWLDLGRIPGFNEISEDQHNITIGGGATFGAILHNSALQRWALPLVQAAGQVGAVQIQNRATLAGNLVNASPAADSVPALFVLDASVVLRSANGQRTMKVQDFAVGPGKSVKKANEILTEVLIPKKPRDGKEVAFFEKQGQRKSQTISIASVAFRGRFLDGRLHDIRIALGAVAPTVILSEQSARHLMDGPLTEDRISQAGELAAQACRPIDDLRATAVFRRRLVYGLLVRGLMSFKQELTPEG